MYERVLKWYKGKALEKVNAALQLLAASVNQGQWIPGASRKVDTALNKATEAKKFAKEHEHTLRKFKSAQEENAGWAIYMGMNYGQVRAAAPDFAGIRADSVGLTDDDLALLRTAEMFWADFEEIADAMDVLDATRPKPVFTHLKASPTITKTLEDAGLDLDLSTIRICPIRWERIEYQGKDGKTYYKWVGWLEYPEGTRHHQSRFAGPDAIFDHCEACGHSIRNPFNWVPFIINGKNGAPYSLWTGRDCAVTLFGVKMVGELELRRPDDLTARAGSTTRKA